MTETSPEPNAIPVKQQRSWSMFLLQWGAILSVLLILLSFFLPAPRNVQPAFRRTICLNNLRNIGLAIHNYHQQYGSMPPAYTVDAQENRLHSWRTLLLPQLDEGALYKTIDLSKPWNDPANELAFKTAIKIFQCPETHLQPTETTFMAMIGEDFCLHPTRGRKFSEIKDGMSQTVMLFETDAKHAVHWMDPTDVDPNWFLEFNANSALPHRGTINMILADGGGRTLSATTPVKTRQALMTIAGGDQVGEY